MIKAEDVWYGTASHDGGDIETIKKYLNQARQEQQEADIEAVVNYFEGSVQLPWHRLVPVLIEAIKAALYQEE